MKIEILHTRSPDYGCEHTVFVDGVMLAQFNRIDTATQVLIESVDAGAGHDAESWQESTKIIANDTSYSEEFKALLVHTRNDPPGHEYIDGWEGVQADQEDARLIRKFDPEEQR